MRDDDDWMTRFWKRISETQWSLVLGIRDEGTRSEALAKLCVRYWYVGYAYLRRRGWTKEDAIDHTQHFFQKLISPPSLASLAKLEPAPHAFRKWFYTALRHHHFDALQYLRAAKRDPRMIVDFDAEEAEMLYAREDPTTNPEELFTVAWECEQVRQARERLMKEYEAKGQGDFFAAAEHLLQDPDTSEPCYARMAENLGLKLNTFKSLVHRMRKRFYHLILEMSGLRLVGGPDGIP